MQEPPEQVYHPAAVMAGAAGKYFLRLRKHTLVDQRGAKILDAIILTEIDVILQHAADGSLRLGVSVLFPHHTECA